MSCNFGFPAVSAPSEHTFVSYSRFDAERVAPIAKLINDDRPVWYDEGLVAGQEWEKMIIEQVNGCKAAAFFVSRDLLGRDKSYVCDEFCFATEHGKPALCVLLDDVSDLTPSDAMRDLWDGLQKLPAVSVYDKPTDTEKAQAVLAALDALERKAPAPDTDPPKSEPNPTPKPEPKPEGGFAKFLGSKLFKAAVAIPVAAALAVGSTVAARHFLGNDQLHESMQLTANDTSSTEVAVPRSNAPHYVTEMTSANEVKDGDLVIMGRYNGQPIKWRVLEKRRNDMLLITDRVLCQSLFESRYGTPEGGDDSGVKSFSTYEEIRFSWSKVTKKRSWYVHWDNSSLREWLNGEFLNSAFSTSELSQINYSTHMTPDNEVSITNYEVDLTHSFDDVNSSNYTPYPAELFDRYVMTGGTSTRDRLFLLSLNECETYFPTMQDREAFDMNGNSSRWWLRSPGFFLICVLGDDGVLYNEVYDEKLANVQYDGFIGPIRSITTDMTGTILLCDNLYEQGESFYFTSGVRPAMWVHIGD